MKGILAILMAGMMVLAIAVPMAMGDGDSATQSATVNPTGALKIVQADDGATPVGAIAFGSGAPGTTLRPTPTGDNATFALNNTYNNAIVVSLTATNLTGTKAGATIAATAESGLLADTDTAKTDAQINDSFPMNDAGYTMDSGSVTPTTKYTWLKLELPNDAVADAYNGTLTVTATPE